jgi:tRNA pseudouridine55 synthase
VRGGLIISKPVGISSFDVIRHLRRILPKGVKLGHSGTLDPSAGGLLLILVGEATRIQHLLKDLDKEYLAGVRLGLETDTLDMEGKVVSEMPVADIEEVTIRKALSGLEGRRMQRPPVFSAIKVQGRRSYERARAGEDFRLAEREVVIYEIELLRWEKPVLEIRTRVSSGTYIRSLAKEIGVSFELPASLEYLKRTRIGPFSLEDACELETLSMKEVERAMIPVKKLIEHLPQADIDDDTALRLLQGKPVTAGVARAVKLWSRRLLFDDGAENA